jgi:4-carboxymuconolactone decarboxylase
VEWNGHEQAALKAGVDARVIDVVRKNGPLTGVPEQDATIIRFGRQMYSDRKVDSATFAKAVEQLGQRGVIDLVAVMNTYAVSGFYAIAVDEHAPANRPSLEPLK